jgi:hypothetical protein
VGELVQEKKGGAAREGSVDVEFLEVRAAVLGRFSRDDLEPFELAARQLLDLVPTT